MIPDLHNPKRATALLTIVGLLLVGLLAAGMVEHRRRQAARIRVLSASEADLRAAGCHFIVGFEHFGQVRLLARRGAIGGIYLSRDNVADESIDRIRARIDALQAERAAAGLPPLLVAADQEGGAVSHLSPPLTRLPPLSSLVGTALNRGDLSRGAAAYAVFQARELAALGVNLNLGPMVDLPNRLSDRDLPQTCLQRRAISMDKLTVAQVADAYCRNMLREGVWPTLKHFPGLGSIDEETHERFGQLDRGIAQLSISDWFPYRRVLDRTPAFLMLGHVRLLAVDPACPASTSRLVVQGILRSEWQFDGIVITDDLTMDPVLSTAGGIGQSAVNALNAGVDLLLVAHGLDQYYTAMAAVLNARERAGLDARLLADSLARLQRLWSDPTRSARSPSQMQSGHDKGLRPSVPELM